MTNVIPLARVRVAEPVQSTALPTTLESTTFATAEPHSVARQQAIENALSTALHFIRQPHSSTALQAATGRASRALTLLKNTCAEAKIGGAA